MSEHTVEMGRCHLCGRTEQLVAMKRLRSGSGMVIAEVGACLDHRDCEAAQQGRQPVTIELPEKGKRAEGLLADAEFRVQWFSLADGAYLVNVIDPSGECIDMAMADNPEDAILAVVERLLPQ